jgi:PKD domain
MKTLVLTIALVLLVPAVALGKTTADFTYKSSGKAATPDPGGTGDPTSYEDIPFKIASDEANGTMSVEVHWTNPADDFDLNVYRKNSTGGLDLVGTSGGAPPSTSEQTSVEAQGGNPVPPGDYVIRVQNYLSTSPDFEGFVKFGEFKVPNARPVAKLKAVKTVTAGKASVLDASGSRDSDGKIANYAWDLDGDGSIETNGGSRKTLKHKFSPGVHHVTVRVTDNGGKRAYATRTVRVSAKK